MSNLNSYEIKERLLTRNLFYGSRLVSDLKFTEPGSFSTYDGEFNFNGTRVVFEVKCRDFSIDKFDSWIMQADKLRNLSKHECQTVYINYFTTPTEGCYSAILFNITKRLQAWKNNIPYTTMTMNDATFKSRTKKIEKNVILLKYEREMGDGLYPKFFINIRNI